MTKEETPRSRVATLQQEAEKALRDICFLLERNLHMLHVQEEVRRLREMAEEAAGIVRRNESMAQLAQANHDEVQKVADVVSALRKRVGAAADVFQKKFENMKGHLDGRALADAAINVRRVLDCRHERLNRFVLHLLVTPGLLAGSRHAASLQDREDDGLRRIGIDAGQHDAGFWPRVDAMLDVVEKLGQGFTIEQLKAFKELDEAEEALDLLVSRYSKTHEGRPWKEWPEVWSVASQRERADSALKQFAQAFVAEKCHEELDSNRIPGADTLRTVCRRYERAIGDLAMARLEARVEALEARVAKVKSTRPAKPVSRAKSRSKPTKKKGGAR